MYAPVQFLSSAQLVTFDRKRHNSNFPYYSLIGSIQDYFNTQPSVTVR